MADVVVHLYCLELELQIFLQGLVLTSPINWFGTTNLISVDFITATAVVYYWISLWGCFSGGKCRLLLYSRFIVGVLPSSTPL